MKSRSNRVEEMQKIITAVSAFPHGATSQDIKKAAELNIDDKNLRRRLLTLVKQGKVKVSGTTRDRLYYLNAEAVTEAAKAESIQDSVITPQLSQESKNILLIIKRPEADRNPVGYNRSFLDSYKPNETSYLSENEKKSLAEVGKTPTIHQPAGTYARQILNRLLIDLSWNSSRLEGNTYSLLDTKRLLSGEVMTEEKSAMETQMILNHKEAIEFLVQDPDNIGFNRYTITSLHALLSNNLLPDSAASGRLRNFAVGIAKSVYSPPDIPQQIEELFDIIVEKADRIKNPFEQAFFIMVHLPYLQPFDDVNKRVSRLAANIPFNRHNLAPLSFTDVPRDLYVAGLLAVYELNNVTLFKDVFIWAYQRSAIRYSDLRQTLGEPDPFRMKHRDAMRKIIKEIIVGQLSPSEASSIIKRHSLTLPLEEQSRFVVTVDTELLNLHDGNFARYHVTPSEFSKWKQQWLLSIK
jgi:hypothetical protein